MVELRVMNAKLMASKFDKESYLEHNLSYYRSDSPNILLEHSILSERKDIEKKRLEHKISILTKEMETIRKRYENKLIELRMENKRKIDVYTLKLSHISCCLNSFIMAMQKLQTTVIKKDASDIEQLRKNFEIEKAQLIKLSKNLLNTEIGGSMLLMRGKDVGKSKSVFDNRRKSLVEKLNSSREYISPNKSLSYKVEAGERGTQTAAASCNESITDVSLKINKLETLITEKLASLVRRIEKQVLLSLSEFNHKTDIENQKLEKLKELVVILTSSKQCTTINQPSSIPQDLKRQQKELNVVIENNRSLIEQNTSKDLLIQNSKEVTKRLQQVDNESSLDNSLLYDKLQLHSLKDSFNHMLNEYKERIQNKVKLFMKQLSNTMNLFSHYKNQQAKKRCKLDILKEEFEDKFNDHNTLILNRIKENEVKFNKLEHAINKLKAKDEELIIELASEKLKCKSLECKLNKSNTEIKNVVANFINKLIERTERAKQDTSNALRVMGEAKLSLISIKMTRLKQELERKKKIIEGLTKKNNEYKNRFLEKDVLLLSLEKGTVDNRLEVEELKAKISEKDKVIADIKIELFKLKKTDRGIKVVEEKDLLIEELKETNAKKLEEVKANYEQRMTELNSRVQSKLQDFVNQKKELELKHIDQYKILNEEIKNLEEKMREKDEELKSLKDLNKRLSDDSSETQKMVLNLKNNHEANKEYIDERKFNEMNDTIETLKDQLEEKNLIIEKFKQAEPNINTKGSNKDIDDNRVKELEEELARKEEAIDDLTKDIEELQVMYNNLKLEFTQYKNSKPIANPEISNSCIFNLVEKIKELVINCIETIPLK